MSDKSTKCVRCKKLINQDDFMDYMPYLAGWLCSACSAKESEDWIETFTKDYYHKIPESSKNLAFQLILSHKRHIYTIGKLHEKGKKDE